MLIQTFKIIFRLNDPPRRTLSTLAMKSENIIEQDNQSSSPTIYRLPLTEYFRDEQYKNRVCIFGSPNEFGKKTGTSAADVSGKTTVIDALVNHIFM